jgi:chromosome segregation ATPase
LESKHVNEMFGLERQVKTMKNELLNKDEVILQLQQQIANSKSTTTDTISEQTSNLKRELETVQFIRDTLQTRQRELEIERDQISTLLEMEKKERASLALSSNETVQRLKIDFERQISLLKTEHSLALTEVQTQNNSYRTTSDNLITKLRDEVDRTKQSLRSKENECMDKIMEIDNLRRNLSSQETSTINRIVHITTERDALLGELNSFKNEIIHLKELNTRYKEEVETIKQVLKTTTRDRDSLSEILSNTRSELLDLRVQNDQLREELQHYSDVLKLNEKTMSSFNNNATTATKHSNVVVDATEIELLLRQDRSRKIQSVIERLDNAKKRQFFSVWKDKSNVVEELDDD